MEGVENVGGQFCGRGTGDTECFPSLEVLKFRDMHRWSSWQGVEVGDFPRLQELHITDCPRLVGLPTALSSITKLSMQRCRSLAFLPGNLPFLSHLSLGDCHENIWDSLPHTLPVLKFLRVAHFKSLKFLPLSGRTALKMLEISDCCQLSAIGSSGSSSLAESISLEHLKIRSCPQLSLMPDVRPPSTLQDMNIRDCPLLKEWHQQVAVSARKVFMASVGQENLRIEQRELEARLSSNPARSREQLECEEAVSLHGEQSRHKRHRLEKYTQINEKDVRSGKKARHKRPDLCDFWNEDGKMDVQNSSVMSDDSDAHSAIQFEPLKRTSCPTQPLPILDLNAELSPLHSCHSDLQEIEEQQVKEEENH